MNLLPMWELQKALYAYLAAQTEVQTLIGTPARIYDEVPEEAIFPYITIGEGRSEAYDGLAHCFQHDLRLHIWSRYGGRAEVKQIMGVVHDVLQGAVLVIPNHHPVSMRYIFGDVFRKTDQLTWHASLRYRAVTQAFSGAA